MGKYKGGCEELMTKYCRSQLLEEFQGEPPRPKDQGPSHVRLRTMTVASVRSYGFQRSKHGTVTLAGAGCS
jgi:hypothetical protein